jgi:hypothetical protein
MSLVAQPLCELPKLAILFFAQTVKVGGLFFATLAVCVQWLCDQQNPLDLKNRFLHQWMRCCTDHSFETGDFDMENRGSWRTV